MSYGVATQTGVSAAIQSIPSMMANKGLRNGYGATFAENFTDGTNVLDPRITFSRASNATVTNSSGLIQYAPHNLLTYSEQFDNSAVWIPITATVSANNAVAPNGTTTADKLIVTNGQAAGYVTQATSLISGVTYTYTVYAKAAGVTSFRILGPSAAFGSGVSNQTGNYDLTTGVASVVTGTPTVSMENVGNGWYRCLLTTTATSTTTSGVQLRIAVTGNGVDGVFIWGAQLNVGSLQPYYPTTVKNLLGFSEAFDNAAWGKVGTSVSATKVESPLGTLLGQKLVEDTTTGVHNIQQSVFSVENGKTYSVSVYAKSAGRNFLHIRGMGIGGGGGAVFNLSTGVIQQVAGYSSAFIESVGNGWYRCTAVGTATAGGTLANPNFGCSIVGGSSFSYTGDGTSGIYIFGAQMADATSVVPYVNNPVAAPTAAAYYGPRFDYDPVTLQPKGLLIEEQRSNLLLQSEAFDNASWTKTGGAITANSIVSPDGTQDADTLVENPTGTGQCNIAQSASFTNAVSYTASIYVKQGTETFCQILFGSGGFGANAYANFNLATGVLGTVGSSATATITAVGNGWYRCTMTAPATATTSTSFQFNIIGSATDARAPTITLDGGTVYIWGAQVEAGAFATSYIPTTSAQVTRSADIALIQGSNFSGWYNQSEGSVFAAGSSLSTSYTAGVILDIGAGGSFGSTAYINWSGTQWALAPNSAPMNVNSVVTTSNSAKVIAGLKANDSVISANGILGTVDTSCAVPASATTLTLGKGGWSGASNWWNGHIRSLAYYPRRLSNTELQAVTQ